MRARRPSSPRLCMALFFMGASFSGCAGRRGASGEETSQVIEDFAMTQTAAGRKAWALAAPQARLLAEGGARMLRPRIRIFREGREGSIAEAREAYVKDGSQDIMLVGDVVIRSPQEKAVLRTDRLEYGAREGRFRTESLVLLERPGARVRGRGLDADAALAEIRIHHMESDLQ